MNWLTRQEQFVLATVLALLLAGWAVKTYRTANPTAQANAATVNLTNAASGSHEQRFKP